MSAVRYLARILDETALVCTPSFVIFALCSHSFILPAAFALSSGTIGAALSSSLSKMRSVALSYGTVQHPTPTSYFEPAHILSSRIISYLWNNWGLDQGGIRNGEVDLYNVNIPMIAGLLSEEGLHICWTRMWRNSYGRLFKEHIARTEKPAVSPAGPDSLDSNAQGILENGGNEASAQALTFKFAPDMRDLINPNPDAVPVGSDGWAISKGFVSVTPIRACFAEPEHDVLSSGPADAEQIVWKMKL